MSVTPPGDQHVDRDTGSIKVLRHDRAERLERRLGWPVGRGTGVQHRAEAGRDVDDPSPTLAHHLGHDGIRQRQRCGRVNRDEAAPLIGRNLPELEGAPPTVWTDCSRANTGVVDEDVDAAEQGARGFGGLIAPGVAG